MKSGERIAGRYRIERELGKGGMGAVYEATDTQTGRRVALKIATVSGRNMDLFRTRFEREAKIGAFLGREEGLVRATAWGELPGDRVFLTMDLVPAARALDLRVGSREERLRLLVRASELVEALHEQGVMHRDVKPENFLVDREGRLHLSDFGLAKPFRGADLDLPAPGDTNAAHTQSGVGVGTPIVMPPEQFKDLATVDARADVYALGVMLFLALTGKLPYEGSAPQVVQRQMRVALGQAQAPSPRRIDPGVPEELDDVCAAALSLERDQRPRDATAFLAQLRSALRGERQPRRRCSAEPEGLAQPARSERPARRASSQVRPGVRRPPQHPPTVGGFRASQPEGPGLLARLLRWTLRLAAGAALAGGVLAVWWFFLRPPVKPGLAPYPGESAEVRTVRTRVLETEDPGDMFELGRRLAEGDGVSRDPTASRHWLVESATRGHVPAMVRLGELYRERDREQAIYWLKKAARKGSQDARRGLQQLGKPVRPPRGGQ